MTYDDDKIGRIVRDAADDWTIPPIRLERGTWRDRVRPQGRAARVLTPSRWLRPLGRAAGLAVALVVVVAIVGVVLNTRAPSNPVAQPPPIAATASPTASASAPTASASASASVSPNPALSPNGELPSVTTAIVRLENGQFSVVDLATGKAGPAFGTSSVDSIVRRSNDGSIVCVCVSYVTAPDGKLTDATVQLMEFDSQGLLTRSQQVGDYVGAPDPRSVVFEPAPSEDVRVNVSFTSDGRRALIGWSLRQHPAWKSGVEVLDLSTHQIAGALDLPAVGDGDGTTRRINQAPVPIGEVADRLILSRSYYTMSPVSSDLPDFVPGVDVFSATLNGTIPTSPTPVDGPTACGDMVQRAGTRADGGMWLECVNRIGQVVLERFDADEQLIGATAVDGVYANGIDGELTASSADGQTLYVWDPIELVLVRVDVNTGQTQQAVAERAQSQMDLLGSLGNWLIPSTQAKAILSSGLVISPDGQNLYAVGVGSAPGSEPTGSVGIYKFTLGETMTSERWAPAADFVSVAVSADGRWVYACGMPGVDAIGRPNGQQASVTVYDAETGAVARVAQNLGMGVVTFTDSVLR